MTLIRFYQKLLNNVPCHLKASKVTIRFRIHVNQVKLEFEDKGVGFLTPRNWLNLVRKGHLGLVGLQKRGEMIGGSVEIDARPSAGTHLCVITPR